MKTFILLPIILIGVSHKSNSKNFKDVFKTYQDPIANAGPDQTIYLTQTSTVTLDGSASSGDAYQWAEISTDFNSGTITLPTSKITTVTGLIQGTFYYQLSATTGGIVKRDTVVVRVEYDVPPANSTLYREFNMADPSIWKPINDRGDTINYYPVTNQPRSQAGTRPDNRWYLFRSRANGLTIDSSRGKLLSLIEDGYGGEKPSPNAPTYARAEIQLEPNSFPIDTSRTYIFEWKGYFPNTANYLSAADYNDVVAFQIHGGVYDYAIMNFRINHTGIIEFQNEVTGERVPPKGDFYESIKDTLFNFIDFMSKSHTFRVTVREGLGYPGQKAFLKLEVDGVQMYYRNTGGVGSAYFDDYVKFGGLYDPPRKLVNPDSLSRGRKFGLVTESFRIYQLNDVVNNIPPTANSGSNKSITFPTNTVSLSGSGSDADGTISSYLWTKISGPASFKIVNPFLAITDVSELVQGKYVFELKVTDNKGASSASTVEVTVNPANNIAPVANAGANKSATLPTNIASLSGSGTDADGTISSYLWTKISGPASFKIVNPSLAITDVSELVQGIYVFELKVTDNKGASSASTVQVTVNPANNIAPVANAGANKSATLPTNTASLSGSGTDADGTISSYLWTKISGPTSFNIVNPSSPVTDVSGLVQGVYVFELKITDNKGATGTSTVQVTINAAANQPPTANAGTNIAITLPLNSVLLSGSGSDPDGKIVAYNWSKTSGPSSFNIVNASSAATNVTGLVQGVYQFELTVTDDKGTPTVATVQVTVKGSINTPSSNTNIPPIANAGNDTTVLAPVLFVTLRGNGMDADGKIVGYLWSQVSGPSQSTMSPNNEEVVNIGDLTEGVYEFELKVTDNSGAEGRDTVTVIVAAARMATEMNKMKVYPNPVNDIVTLEISTSKNSTNLSVVITDMSGKSVYDEQFVSSGGDVKKQVNMSNLIKGTYIITVFFDWTEKSSIKIVKM